MPLQEQTSLWSDTAIKMLDGYSGTLQTGSVLHETELTSNVLLLAYGGEGELAMDGEGCHIGASFACHVVKGSSYTLTARSVSERNHSRKLLGFRNTQPLCFDGTIHIMV
ncbi:hypothetical protein NST38_07880 [Paenibacillus sp. FSL H8-0104]|uniref:hypothetical protein n=1 Tax=Paenibacillus sp. FSL H8-0104 TaxID=2954509 RepID=UPI0030FD86C0